MRDTKNKLIKTNEKFISNFTYDESLNVKKYTSTKLAKANKILAGLNLTLAK